MAVNDGQNVNASVTNAAFMSRLQNTSTIGEVELDNTTNPDSGDKITNAQRLINELKDVQGNVGEGDTTAKNYATNNVVTNGEDRKEAIEAIDATYNGTTGHSHDGTDGNGAKVSATNLDDFNNLFAEFGEYTFDAASGTSIDVSALFTSQTAGGDDVTEGVITSAPNNYVPIVEKTNGGEIEDGEGDRVFARLTESAGTWTLSFYTNEAGTETAHNLTSQDIRFLYREVFTSANRPTIGANVGVYDTQSAIGDIPDASNTQRGVVSTSAQTLAGNKNFQDGLEVGGVDVVDLSSAQTMTSKTFGDEVTLTELGATPTTPSAGLMKIYPKTDKKMYKLDDTGAETELGAGGAGGGSGIRNFAQEFQNADSTTGYSTGQSATFDDTGTLGATFSVDSATPIFGTDSLKLENINANDWVSIRDIAIDTGARGCLLAFKINYTYNGDDLPLLKVKDGDGNEVDENRIKIFNTTQDSKNQREAKCLWVQPQSGTASETVTIGFHFPNATGVEDFVFDEVIVTDDSVTVVESSEQLMQWLKFSEPGSSLQDRTSEVRFSTSLTDSIFTGDSVLTVEDDAANTRTKFVALKNCSVNVSFSGRSTAADDFANIYVNGLVAYRGSDTPGANRFASAESEVQLLAGEFLTVGVDSGSSIANDSNLVYLNISAKAELTQSRFLIEQGENIINEYSARIQNNGSTATVVSSNTDFFTAVRHSLGRIEITWTPGLFSVAPTVIPTVDNSGTIDLSSSVDNLTSSGCTIYTGRDGVVLVDKDININVSRQGTDVKNGLGVAAIAGKTHEDDSCIRLVGGLGEGSTNTRVRTFDSLITNEGSAITYNASSIDGDEFLINESGNYSISYTDSANVNANHHGISLNSTELTTNVNVITPEDILALERAENTAAAYPQNVSWQGFLQEGDIVRAHTDGQYSAYTRASFTISKVGQQPLLDAGAVISEDPSKINSFSSRVTSSGVITSTSHEWFTVVDSGTGILTLTFTENFLIPPAIDVQGEDTDYITAVGSLTTSGCIVYTYSSPNVLADANVAIECNRQGIDVVPLADRVSSFSSTVYKTRTSRTAILKDVKASGVAGGTFTSGAWQTRTINTQEGGGSFCSISSNQVTLNAGTYLIKAYSPAYAADFHKCKLYNITDAADEIIGTSEYANSGGGVQNASTLSGEITITSTKVFELQARSSRTEATLGFGRPASFGVDEVYSQIIIEKLD